MAHQARRKTHPSRAPQPRPAGGRVRLVSQLHEGAIVGDGTVADMASYRVYDETSPKCYLDDIALLRRGIIDRSAPMHPFLRNNDPTALDAAARANDMPYVGPISLAELETRGLALQDGSVIYSIHGGKQTRPVHSASSASVASSSIANYVESLQKQCKILSGGEKRTLSDGSVLTQHPTANGGKRVVVESSGGEQLFFQRGPTTLTIITHH